MEEDTGKSRTSAARPAASTAPTTRWSTTTGPASRWSRSSPSRSTGTGALAPEVARAYVTELRDMLRALGVSDVRMEQGSLRCDVNTSIAPDGPAQLGHPDRDQERQLAALGRAGRAVRDRARRPAVLDAGGTDRRRRPGTSTRTPAITTSGRSKEEAEDYRYFPEPDLVPLAPVAGVGGADPRATLPELPRGPAPAAAGRAGACPTLTCVRCATRAPSTWWRTPSRPARPGRRPASGGWASWPGGPTRPSVELDRAGRSRPAQVARVAELVADGCAERQAGPPGPRRRARGRGRPGRGGRRPRPGWSSATTAR